MGCKAAERNHNINDAFGPGTGTERTGQRWCKRATIKADPVTTTEVAEELNVDHSTVIRHLKQTGKVKTLKKWVPCELTEEEKKSVV
ncbi:hypothetical protein AV530_013343 [Patagioenas fasciata monilis]|uniref:Uncharacterized protein n=1 Tax=Patagioenas fasciata monilis TaxID=372326 RepID=A0A1V4JP24_PATFA|nr:hypothetical protein AV530_013343 [Patagioenas fasciata monilis]